MSGALGFYSILLGSFVESKCPSLVPFNEVIRRYQGRGKCRLPLAHLKASIVALSRIQTANFDFKLKLACHPLIGGMNLINQIPANPRRVGLITHQASRLLLAAH
ncbi:hypothetical protein H257_03083 [Aphanomyces astaci]|uniref:Uncharacterized protein n=1 Tax=Aphanomyces astaci TaxID=112090 RepID=W4H292_APHAT|nr:hypothetical protein H257_03083 [Aphanomyces astaci]ETV85288.1 hypothetical protein H257_03083 [Aphanomyces astaci]|eukprot:XP_009825306.1 hypothetical protein H257_03083 [Aphanomyces astaci]